MAEQEGRPTAVDRSGPAPSPGHRWSTTLLLVVLGAAAAASLWIGAAAMGPTVPDVAALDESLMARTADVTVAAVTVTEVGSTLSMGVLAVLVAGWLLARRRFADAVFVLGAAAGGAALFRGLKSLFDRARPPELDRLVTVTNESLPSGHATMSTVVIGSLVVLAWGGRSVAGRVAMVSIAALWVGAVGATRVYLGVHWFTDVVAGWLVGATWLAMCAIAWSWWARRLPAAAPEP